MILFLQGAAKQHSKLLALLLPDKDEPPRGEFPVIRHAHGDLQDLLQLVVRRARTDHLARASGSAGSEQG